MAYAHITRVLTNGGSTTDAASFTTASITGRPNELLLCGVVNSHGSAATTPTITSWTQIATVTFGSFYRVTLFRRQESGIVSGTQSIAFGGTTQTGCRWDIVGFPFALLDTANNGAAAVANSATNTSSAAALTVNFAGTVARTSAGYFVSGNNGNTAQAARTNWTEIADAGHTTPNTRIQTQRRNVLNTETAGGTGTAITGAGIVVEVLLNIGMVSIPEGMWRRRMLGILGR